jgi:hypothetical protein
MEDQSEQPASWLRSEPVIFSIRSASHSNTTFKDNKGCTIPKNKNKNKHGQDILLHYLITLSVSMIYTHTTKW